MPPGRFVRVQDPFAGLASTATRSNIVDSRSAFDLSLSFRTTSGTTSYWTYQISNDTARADRSIAENSWSDWTAIGDITRPSSGVSLLSPPLGFRYHRIIRSSGASWQFYINVQER